MAEFMKRLPKTRTRLFGPGAAFALSVLAVGSAHGATFSLTPTIDSLVSTGPTGNLVNNNYGGAGALSLSAGGLEMGELQSVLQFNLAGAVSSFDATYGAGQWSLESITLKLTAGNANNALFNSPAAGLFGISWMQNDGWLEGTGSPSSPGTTGITFASLQSLFIGPNDQSLGTFGFNGSTSGSYTYSLDLASSFVSDVSAGGDVSLRLSAADSTVSGVFSSRNFGTVGSRPVLTLVAVPEPSSIAIAGLGLALTAVWRMRRRS